MEPWTLRSMASMACEEGPDNLFTSPSRGSRTTRTPSPRDRRSARTAAGSARRSRSSCRRDARTSAASTNRGSDREFRPIVIMMCAAAYGPTPGSARRLLFELVVGQLGRGGRGERFQVELAVGDGARQRSQVGASVARPDHVPIERAPAYRPSSRASGTRSSAVRYRRSPGRPRCSTIAFTMRSVALHAQFVVQTVFTTSSKTVGLWSILPAPVTAHARSGSCAAFA